MLNNKKLFTLLITGLFFFTANTTAFAAPAIDKDFNPNNLIDDRIFSNANAMPNAAAVQAFLESKNSILANTSADFVARLKEPTSSMLKQTLEDPNPNLGRNRSAAELIFDASKSAGINPQVILVTLNKEQSLVTGRQNATPEQLQRALDFSMGFGCPDTAPCGELYRGFYAQLFGNVDPENNRYLGAAKSLMRSFETPGGRGPFFNGRTTKVGDVVSFTNSIGGYDGVMPVQSVVLSNSATAALYRYTPHVFNGNYNFWRFFKEWFGNPSSGGGSTGTNDGALNGKVVKTSRSASSTYYVENGQQYRLYQFVAEARNLSMRNPEIVSRRTLEKYPSGGNLPVPDNTLVEYKGEYFLFQGNKRYLLSEEAVRARGLNPNNAIGADDAIRRYETGNAADLNNPPAPTVPTQPTTPVTPIPPAGGELFREGAVLRGKNSPAVYLFTGGKLKLFTFATFIQHAAAQNLTLVDDNLLDKYPKDGLVLPKNGSLVKSFNSPTVYYFEDNQKKPMDGEIFRNRGFSFTNVFELDQAEIDALPMGKFPLPANGTYYQHKKTGELFVYRDGQKRFISKLVALNRGITPDFVFGEDTVDHLPSGPAVMPKDGLVLKGDKSPAVYQVVDGKLALMSYQAFVGRKIDPKQISVVPDSEIALYPTGPVLER